MEKQLTLETSTAPHIAGESQSAQDGVLRIDRLITSAANDKNWRIFA